MIDDNENISLTYTKYFLGTFLSFFCKNNYYSKKYFVFMECKSKILSIIELENSVIMLLIMQIIIINNMKHNTKISINV